MKTTLTMVMFMYLYCILKFKKINIHCAVALPIHIVNDSRHRGIVQQIDQGTFADQQNGNAGQPIEYRVPFAGSNFAGEH